MDASGAIVRLSGIIQDITERARTEEEMLRSLRRMAVASRSAGLGFWEYDVGANVELWDDPMYAIYGVSLEEFEPTYGGWTRWVHPDDLQQMVEAEQQALAAGKSFYSRFRIRRSDGQVRHVEVHAEVERDETGKPLRLLGVDRDITELIESEQQMQLQSAALMAAANAIVITALDGSIEWINPAFTALTGYTVEESVGRKLGALLRSGMQEAPFYESLWSSILAGQVWQGELINRRKDGSLYIEEQAITPVLDAGGAVTHFVAIKQDISARKQHEREMEAVIAVSAALRTLTTRAAMLPVIIDQLLSLFDAEGAALVGRVGRLEGFACAVPLAGAVCVVRSIQERWDGTGEPDKRAGESIPFASRVIAVVKKLDDLTSGMDGRAPLSLAQGVKELESAAGTQCDAACVEALARWVRAGGWENP